MRGWLERGGRVAGAWCILLGCYKKDLGVPEWDIAGAWSMEHSQSSAYDTHLVTQRTSKY